MTFNPTLFRQQFPFLQQNNLVYLDSAATALKPKVLLEATQHFYLSAGSVHRSQYDAEQTHLFEQARLQVQKLINAESEQAVIWTSGTTQAINTVAYGLQQELQPHDEIIISQAEHHANFVPWQQIAQKTGAKLLVLPMQENGLLDPIQLRQWLSPRTKLVALNFVSNVTGTAQPIQNLSAIIRQHSQALILVDAAQAIGHQPIDLQQLDVDFIAFSAHKLYGPTGLGVLSGKLQALEKLQPLLFGGKMVDQVSAQQITFQPLPYRLEAGTPNIAAVIGFDAVLNWLQQWDLQAAEQYSIDLAQQVKARLSQYPHCQLFPSAQPSNIVSFIFNHLDCGDLATLLAEQHIALRVGKHCAQPYLQHLKQRATMRLSFSAYNNQQDVDSFFQALDNSLSILLD